MSFSTYLTYNVLHTFPDWTKEPEFELIQTPLSLRNPIGVDYKYTEEDYVKYKATNKYSPTTKAEISEFNDLFDELKGRWGMLWLPSWGTDFVLSQAIGAADTILQGADVSFSTNYGVAPAQTGRYVFIYKNTSQWWCRKVTAATDSSLTIDSAIGVALALADVKYVSILYFARFDIDEIEWEYITPDVAECELSFIELPHEYPT